MKTQLRKVGNSVGQIIPAPLLRQLGLEIGDELELRIEDGQLVAVPIKKKQHYDLADLLAKCDDQAPIPVDEVWGNLEPVGLELDDF